MTTVLQISDSHLVQGDGLVDGQLNPSATLEMLVERISAMREQLGSLDAILHTGDLSDDGSQESYQKLEAILEPLELPVFAIPGNHDGRENMRSALFHRGYLPAAGKLHWKKRFAHFDMIGVDTLVEGYGGGVMDDEALAYLEEQLGEAESRPVLIAMHHPPFECGIELMDDIGLEGRDSLAALLRRYDNEIRVVCGHIHSTMVATVGGKVALSGPSSHSVMAYDTRAVAEVGHIIQSDGFLLHQWRGSFRSVKIDDRVDT